jgi:hypothetical protein
MNRYQWIGTVYGYVICVVAVVTSLISASQLVDAAFDLGNPLQGRGGYYGPGGGSLTSFEAFRATEQRPMRVPPNATVTVADTPSTAEQRTRYEMLRADRIAQARYQAGQRLVKHGLLILLAIALFTWHWRWLRTQRDTATP